MCNHALISNHYHMEASAGSIHNEAELESLLKVNCEVILYLTYKL